MDRKIAQNHPLDSHESLAKIMLLTPFVDYAFFKPVRRGAEDAAQRHQMLAIFDGVPGDDLNGLSAMALRMLDDVDGLAINMTKPGIFKQVAIEAKRRDRPLISFNVDDPSVPRLATVGQNMFEAGRLVGHAIAPLLGAGDRILLTMHDEGISALEDRAAGIRQVLDPIGATWTTLVTGTVPEQAVEKVHAKLAGDSGIKAVLGTGMADTEAIGRALVRCPHHSKYVAAGFDTSPDILRSVGDGVLRFTVDQQPYAQGYFAVVALALAIRGCASPPNVDTGARLLRAEDLGPSA